jgi:hypothetical protein
MPLVFLVVLVVAYHLIWEDPRGNDGKYKETEYNADY